MVPHTLMVPCVPMRRSSSPPLRGSSPSKSKSWAGAEDAAGGAPITRRGPPKSSAPPTAAPGSPGVLLGMLVVAGMDDSPAALSPSCFCNRLRSVDSRSGHLGMGSMYCWLADWGELLRAWRGGGREVWRGVLVSNVGVDGELGG